MSLVKPITPHLWFDTQARIGRRRAIGTGRHVDTGLQRQHGFGRCGRGGNGG